MTRREERIRETRDKLLTAAARCFAENGYAGCSVADIAGRAGLAQGTLYVHFSGKEALFRAIIEQEYARGAEKARQAAAATPHVQGVLTVLSECIRTVGFPVDHRLWTEILAVAARDPSVRQTFVAGDQAMRGMFAELLRKAMAAGEIDASLDVNAVSIWLYALVDGLIARTATDPGFDFASQSGLFENLVRRALRPSP